MSKKAKGSQLGLFHEAEGLPIFSGSAYGSRDGAGAFVPKEKPKQAAMFAVTFDELAGAEQAKKQRKAFMIGNGLGEGDMLRQLSAVQSEEEEREEERVTNDAIANSRLYGGVAVVYRVDHSFNWRYMRGPAGSVPVAVFENGNERAFVHRGNGSVEIVESKED